MRLLLIEDNTRLADLVCKGCRQANFSIDHVQSGDEAKAAIAASQFDVVILDLGLPDCDGLDLLKELRQANCTAPILILTAREKVADKITGLNDGADDYLTKPFDMNELLARIKALLRRPGGVMGTMLTMGNLEFDTRGPNVAVDGRALSLSRRELALLEALMRRGQKVVSRRALEDSVYSFDQDIESNALEAGISRLRRKLELAGAKVDIHTIRGVGYMIMEPDADIA